MTMSPSPGCALNTSIGHYARQLPKVKGGGKAGAKDPKAEKVAPKLDKAAKVAKAEVVSSGDVAEDTWNTYRSRVHKRAAKEAIALGLSPDDASEHRKAAGIAAKAEWNAMI